MSNRIDAKERMDDVISQSLQEEFTNNAVVIQHAAQSATTLQHEQNMQTIQGGPAASDTYDGKGQVTVNPKYTGGTQPACEVVGTKAADTGDAGSQMQQQFDEAERFKVADVIKNDMITNKAIRG